MNAFLKKFAHLIIGILLCFDRVIFKGHLPFGDNAHLNTFVDNVLKISSVAGRWGVVSISQAKLTLVAVRVCGRR